MGLLWIMYCMPMAFGGSKLDVICVLLVCCCTFKLLWKGRDMLIVKKRCEIRLQKFVVRRIFAVLFFIFLKKFHGLCSPGYCKGVCLIENRNFPSFADTDVLTFLVDFLQWVDLNFYIKFVAWPTLVLFGLDFGKYFLVYESRKWIWLVSKARKVLVKS